MGDENGAEDHQSLKIPRSGSKVMVGEKRGIVEVEESSGISHKRVKIRDLESVLRSEAERTGRDTTHVTADSTLRTFDLNANIGDASNVVAGDIPSCSLGYKKLAMCEKQVECDGNLLKPTGFGLDLNTEDVSSSINNDTFDPHRKYEDWQTRDDECASSVGPLEEKDSMRIWKEMKQNGFLSASHGGVPIPKPRGRKSKNDGIKKRIELAKREQVDRFAKIAAPSGLLNGLNPGIINHVRNSKQVHSIIEALVRSEKTENRHSGSKQCKETKNGISETKNNLENMNYAGTGRCIADGHPNTLSQSRLFSGFSASFNRSMLSHSELMGGDHDSGMLDTRVFSGITCPSDSNPCNEDDILALKLSSSTTIASENNSTLSNEDSANPTSVNSLSVKAANVASQWLELLNQDIKGRLAALRRSKKRVRAVISTELPFLLSREFSLNQENDSCISRNATVCHHESGTANAHCARWSTLFSQMDKSLSEEEKQLESWLSQVKEMQLHCERGLLKYTMPYGLQNMGSIQNDCRLDRADNSERDLAVRAAAASIYSTCNFLSSMENLPCC